MSGRRRCCVYTLGDEFVGKLALLATLLSTDSSGVEARHATIRRVLMNASANTDKLSFQELSACWAFLQARNREVDAAHWEAKRAKLRAAVKEKRARARSRAKAKATVLGRAALATVWRCETFCVAFAKTEPHLVRVCALATHVRGAFLSCNGRVRRAFCSAHMAWRVAENAHLSSQALHMV